MVDCDGGGTGFYEVELNNYKLKDIEAYLKLQEIGLNKFKSENISAYSRLEKWGFIDDFSYVSTAKLKKHLRKRKIEKLNKSKWKFWK